LHARNDTAELGRHQRLILSLQLGLTALGLTASCGAVVAAADSVHRDGGAARAVSVLGLDLTYPAVNVAAAVLLLLAVAGVGILARAVGEAARLRRDYRRFVEALPVVGTLPGPPSASVIPGNAPQAFCAGHWRPRIYISQGAVDLLSEDELAAVLRHEQQHVEARDPLKLACARVMTRALVFLPALAPLSDRSVEIAEVRADDAAVAAAGGDRGALASALLAFESGSPPGSGGLAADRVDALLGKPVARLLPQRLIVISAAVAAAFVVLLWRMSSVASARGTLGLPLLSAQPCMLVLALVPLVALVVLVAVRRPR
jgi:Zn-dependent protease with chaperone function